MSFSSSIFFRSPWTNTYDPPLEDGAMPSESLRKLEIEANSAFDQYRELYFEGGVSSVYLWDLETGFAGVILIKKAGDGSKKIKGCWDSIHVVEVQTKSSGRSAHYKLTSTSMLWLQTNKVGSGTMNLGGSLTRQVEQDASVSDSSPHIANIGKMVEDMENKIRFVIVLEYFILLFFRESIFQKGVQVACMHPLGSCLLRLSYLVKLI